MYTINSIAVTALLDDTDNHPAVLDDCPILDDDWMIETVLTSHINALVARLCNTAVLELGYRKTFQRLLLV